MRRGKVIFGKVPVFVQVDKNNQICDLLSFDRKKTFPDRIGSRIYPDVLNTFRGRPIHISWLNLIDVITKKSEKNEA